MQAETLTAEFGNAGILEVENTEKIAWRASLGCVMLYRSSATVMGDRLGE
jgi:hypothetical protein